MACCLPSPLFTCSFCCGCVPCSHGASFPFCSLCTSRPLRLTQLPSPSRWQPPDQTWPTDDEGDPADGGGKEFGRAASSAAYLNHPVSLNRVASCCWWLGRLLHLLPPCFPSSLLTCRAAGRLTTSSTNFPCWQREPCGPLLKCCSTRVDPRRWRWFHRRSSRAAPFHLFGPEGRHSGRPRSSFVRPTSAASHRADEVQEQGLLQHALDSENLIGIPSWPGFSLTRSCGLSRRFSRSIDTRRGAAEKCRFSCCCLSHGRV